MTAQFLTSEILDICKARKVQGFLDDDNHAICTDSRAVQPGNFFLALSGEKFDGHDFLGQVLAADAAGAIVAERPFYPVGNQQFVLLAVDDTLRAYEDLAREYRLRIAPQTVAITGSSGKTTTKELCASVLSAGFVTHKSQANENNEYGVPKTILSMPDTTQALVLEMGMRGSGQIAQLVATALPEVAVIVNCGTAHIELLGSKENIIKAKCEILERLSVRSGLAVIGSPTDELLNYARSVFKGKILAFKQDAVQTIAVTNDYTEFKLADSEQIFLVNGHGLPIIQDAWCAICVGRQFGMDDKDIASGLADYQPVKGRGSRLLSPSGALIVDESYNANPDSVKAAVSAFVDSDVFPYEKKVVVLGEMRELGDWSEALHREVGRFLADLKFDKLITVGPVAAMIAESAVKGKFVRENVQTLEEVARLIEPDLGQQTAVLIKGSQAVNLKSLVEKLMAYF